MTLCEPGDTVVLESPIYFSLISLLQQLKLKIIEIPAAEDEGIPLETLRFVLENHSVKALFSISNFNNPLGFVSQGCDDARGRSAEPLTGRPDRP